MKNSRKPLIIISMALLLAVVLAMSGVTFAKYITVDEGNKDTATVAKWGWTLSADASTLFSTKYDDNLAAVTTADGTGTLVISTRVDTEGAAQEVVAPGTSGKMTFSIHNSTGEKNTEVRTKVDVKATGSDVTLVQDGKANYLPLNWVLKNGENEVVNGELSEVVAYLNAMTATVEPNAVYTYAGDYELSWEWVDDGQGTNDVDDTLLGSIAAGTATGAEGTSLDVKFTLDIAITQVQDVVVP